MTQVENMIAKQMISVNGVDYRLRRDVSDPTSAFDHNRVVWQNTGCEALSDGVYYCWIVGVVPPENGSLEKPTQVIYIGFHNRKISIDPRTLTIHDLNRMNIYVADYSSFIQKFVTNYLASDSSESEDPQEQRDLVSPFPVVEVENESSIPTSK